MSEVIVLNDGYSSMTAKDEMTANCSCALIKGVDNIIVDTMTAWDSDKILSGLTKHGLSPESINYVVSTHGHSDHIGNNNLFLKARHIVGFSVSYREKYFLHPFNEGEDFIINNSVRVVPTPGHTLSDVTVLVTSIELEKVAITGDLFERFEDIDNPNIWVQAGSEDPIKQIKNRSKIADLANWIVPGHGHKFQVTDKIRESLRRQAKDTL